MRVTVNGETHTLEEVEPWESLLSVLRDRLGLYGAKNACEQGECGSCSVFVDDRLVCACLVSAAQARDREVTTVEGLDDDPVATCVRDRIRGCGGVQCGYCTPGFVVAATAALRADPREGSGAPGSADRWAESLSGNLCRCTGYRKILEAVDQAAQEIRSRGENSDVP